VAVGRVFAGRAGLKGMLGVEGSKRDARVKSCSGKSVTVRISGVIRQKGRAS